MTELDYSKMTKDQLREALEARDQDEPAREDERITFARQEGLLAGLRQALTVHERLVDRIAPDERTLDERMAAVQLELEDVPRRGHAEIKTKDGSRVQYTYDYITEADLMAGVRPLLAKHGIATYYRDELLSEANGKATVRVAITFAANGSERTIFGDGVGTDYGDKAASKAKTTAVRYLLWKTFLQPSDEDPEQDNVDAAEAATRHEARERGAQLRAGDTTRRTDRATGDTTGALIQRITLRAMELDEVHGLTPGATLGKVQASVREANDGLELPALDAPAIVKIGQALANHVTTEREAYEREGLNFTPTEFRLPD